MNSKFTTTEKHAGETTGEKHQEQEVAEVSLGAGPHGEVEVSGGITRNMGDYNSSRMEVAVRMPCHDSEAGYERAYLICSKFVADKIELEAAKQDG